MSPTIRRLLYAALAVLWLTGCAWLVLHFFFQTQSEFGLMPHPWQPTLLILHGIVAVLAVFLLGWICGIHVGPRLRWGAKRTSGIVLLAAGGLLILTGFANYYFTAPTLLIGTNTTHEIVGVLALVPMLVHCFGRRNGNGYGRKPA